MVPSTRLPSHGFVAAAVLAVCLPAAWAAGPDKAAIEAAYQRDRAACQALSPTQDRTSCLRDAGAHRAQALRTGVRGGTSQQQLERNAVQRCQSHNTPEQRTICERMARGEGSSSGSVQGGGTIRELVTTEVLPAPPPPPAPPAMAPAAPMLSTPMPAAPMPPPSMTTPPSMNPPSMNPTPAPLPPAPPPMTR